jgi:hypothetical protein
VLVVGPAACGGEARLEPAGVAGCLADDGISTAPRGDPGAATDVLAFAIPGAPVTNGLLIFAPNEDRAATLAGDIETEAKAQGDEAYLVREHNVIAHFLTEAAPTASQEERIRRCLTPG